MTYVNCQEAIGLKFGNYAGVDRIFLNPALSQSSAFNWEANLASFHAFLYTDYAFISESSLLSLIPPVRIDVLTLKSQVTDNITDSTLIFDLDKGDKTLSGHAELNGPALITNFFFGMKIGLFTKFRANVSSGRISENFGVYELNESFSRQEINFKKGQIAGMMWREIGLHLSKSFELFDVGINIKRANAYEGFFVKVDNDQDVAYPGGFIQFGSNDLGGGVGYTTNGIYADNFDPLKPQGNGGGFLLDLGTRFYLNDLAIGVSVLDLGYVNFKNNVEIYELPDNYTDFNVNPKDYVEIRSLEDLIDQVETDTPFEQSVENNKFVIGTPTAINISTDYPFSKNLFLSASLTQRVKLLNVSTVSDNVMSVIPRFQSNWVSAYLPVTMYNYSEFRVGAAFRFAYLTIGCDDLVSMFAEREFRGSDFYIRLSVTPLFKMKRRKKQKSNQSKSDAKCYEF